MTEIKNVEVYDIKECIVASGLAMRTEPFDYGKEYTNAVKFEKHLKRCLRLVKASKSTDVHCHDNFLTGIRVSFDIKYPQYLSPEMQRYHFFDIVTSMSKMHRLSKISLRQASNKYTSPEVIRIVQTAIDNYNNILSDETIDTFGYWDSSTEYDKWIEIKGRKEALYAAFMVMVSSCPLGLELWMRISTNYKQLQTIYYQRRHHKLAEDWGAVINMIEHLPYFKEFILGEDNTLVPSENLSMNNTTVSINTSSRPTNV